MNSTSVLVAAGDQLDVRTLYELLRLRAQVFVVEQACPYLDVDGHDLLGSTTHMWIAGPDGVRSALRILDGEPGEPPRIGRVVTTPRARGQGLAAVLVTEALARCDGRARLDAQSPLVDWYRRFGFQPCGPEFVEDGIPHVPMIAAV